MKNYLTERIISTIWLFALSYLFLDSAIFFDQHAKGIYFLIIKLSFAILYALFGYFHAYKIFLLPADCLNVLPLRCVAMVWAGAVGFLCAGEIDQLIGLSHPALITLINIAITIFGFYIGWIFLYRLLLFPHIHYKQTFPTLIERTVSSVWFGTIGYCLALIIIKKSFNHMLVFIALFAAYLGFLYGYRILLLPFSVKGAIKSSMIGFIGSSYALLVVLLILAIQLFVKEPVVYYHDYWQAVFALFLVIFPVISLFVGGINIFFSLLLYLLSRLWLKN